MTYDQNNKNDMVEHTHDAVTHTHAWGSLEHNHWLQRVCSRRECAGTISHKVHRGLSRED